MLSVCPLNLGYVFWKTADIDQNVLEPRAGRIDPPFEEGCQITRNPKISRLASEKCQVKFELPQI